MKLLCEAVSLAGVCSVVYGITLWSEPMAWLVGGLIAVATGCLLYPRGSQQ